MPQGNSLEWLGVVQGETEQRGQQGGGKRRGSHRKGVAGTPGASSWKEGVARWAPPSAVSAGWAEGQGPWQDQSSLRRPRDVLRD